MSTAVSTDKCSDPPPPPTPAWGMGHLLPTWRIKPVCNHHLPVRTEFKNGLCHRTIKLLSKVWACLISGCVYVLLILPWQLPVRERGREGEGGKGEEERRGGEKEEKKDKEWGTRRWRGRKETGLTLLCVAAQNSLISILLPLLVSITPSGSLKEGGYQ